MAGKRGRKCRNWGHRRKNFSKHMRIDSASSKIMYSSENAEDESKYNENEENTDVDESYELLKACKIPCHVLLQRLTNEEIQRHLSVVDERFRPDRTQKRIAKNYLRDVSRVDFGVFDQYKRSREAFINKKRNRTADIGDYGFSSGEEANLYSDDEYVPEESLNRKNPAPNRRKRRVAYEEDYEWNPDGRTSVSPKPKKALRNLRVNTRRKRIESNSSSDEDDYYDARTSNSDPFDNEDFYNGTSDASSSRMENQMGDFLWGSEQKQAPPTREAEGFTASLLDPDLITQIVQDMADFREAEGKETGLFRSASRPKQRISRLIKITDKLTPTISEVQQVVRNMVNSVCTIETQREQALEDSSNVQCRWCNSVFLPDNSNDEFCKICKDLAYDKPKSLKRTHKGSKSASKKGPVKSSKIKNKVLKNLPKSEQQRLMHGWKGSNSKGSISAKDANDTHFTTVAEVHHKPQTSLSDSNHKHTNKRKLSESSSVGSSKKLKLKTKIIKTPVSKKTTKTNLLRIDFPNKPTTEEASSSIRNSDSPQQNNVVLTKQPAANSVQYGTYLLPPMPTVVVANYAATDAKNGDYYLSSVYYQNEMTQPKSAIKKSNCAPTTNAATINLNVLPSMPSIDQLSSMPSLEHLSNITISPLTISQTKAAVSVPKIGSNVVANSVDVPQMLPDATYLTQQDIDAILNLNNNNLQVQSVETRTSSVTLESDIASLFTNPHLQIQPVGLPDNLDDQDDSFSSEKYFENNNIDLPLSIAEAENNSPSSRKSSSMPRDTDETSKSSESQSLPQDKNPTEGNPQSDYQSGVVSEEDMSSEALFRKMSDELDAICILGVVDLDRNPKLSLQRIIENNKVECENLSRAVPKNTEHLKKAEENRSTLHLAKTLLNRYGSFSKMSSAFLLGAKILQIKKEKNLEEDSTRSSCQFATHSQSIPEFVEVGAVSIDHIANIESQINSIPPILPESGVIHHFPTPGIPRSESRETPSRGSGPLTPARPESAMSQVEEPAPLTPLQIKKERLEAASSPQTFSSPSVQPSRTILPQPVVSNPMPAGNLMVSVSNQMSGYNPMVSASSQMPSANQNTFILTQRNHPMMQYRTAAGPPNVTATNNQNISKVLMEYASRNQAGQQNINSNNVLFKNGQLVNVQQVYLPQPQGLQQRYNVQQQNPSMNQFNIVQQSQNQVVVRHPQNQVVMRQPQNQVLMGQSQNQVLVGQSQNQVLVSQPQNQVLVGQPQNQVLVGQPQNQVLVGQPQTSVFVTQHQNQVVVNNISAQYSFQSGQVQQRITSLNPSLQAMQHIQPGSSGLLMQNKPNNAEEQMFCALCSKPATLRCKQCAKIAYCDTKCAKTYWHSRHKSECKPMTSSNL